jgi:hypothetical protein
MSIAKCAVLTLNDVQCENTFIAICRHCNVDFCIDHLRQHYQELEKAQVQFQLLLNEMMERRLQLESLEPPLEYEQNRSSLHEQLDHWIVKLRKLIDMSNDNWNQQKARLITETDHMLAIRRNMLNVDTNDLNSLQKWLSQVDDSIQQLTQTPTILPTFVQIISKMENPDSLQNNGN